MGAGRNFSRGVQKINFVSGGVHTSFPLIGTCNFPAECVSVLTQIIPVLCAKSKNAIVLQILEIPC